MTPPDATIAELTSLSPYDRAHLKRARVLMQSFAGKKYRIDLLPLYPLLAEIWFWLAGRASKRVTTCDKM